MELFKRLKVEDYLKQLSDKINEEYDYNELRENHRCKWRRR